MGRLQLVGFLPRPQVAIRSVETLEIVGVGQRDRRFAHFPGNGPMAMLTLDAEKCNALFICVNVLLQIIPKRGQIPLVRLPRNLAFDADPMIMGQRPARYIDEFSKLSKPDPVMHNFAYGATIIEKTREFAEK
ncbi:hypothetical protein [Thioclava electrotropha]|uniref:Uncharacterized protein n=1 Tax=Thioclava electrotropha TaxID=1549850 RepID=A0ABX6YTE4_9RHOB|nr:hypothetical protein [Thioclava electrotropha]QPZ91055.1 hypothetical protein AKL02_009150 [Thioclava electrotropha]